MCGNINYISIRFPDEGRDVRLFNNLRNQRDQQSLPLKQNWRTLWQDTNIKAAQSAQLSRFLAATRPYFGSRWDCASMAGRRRLGARAGNKRVMAAWSGRAAAGSAR